MRRPFPSETEKYLGGLVAGRYFPVELFETKSRKTYRELPSDGLVLGGVKVTHHKLCHPQGSVAYRFEEDGKSVVFATDTEHPEDEIDDDLAEFAAGAAHLVYDATFTPGRIREREAGLGPLDLARGDAAGRGGRRGRPPALAPEPRPRGRPRRRPGRFGQGTFPKDVRRPPGAAAVRLRRGGMPDATLSNWTLYIEIVAGFAGLGTGRVSSRGRAPAAGFQRASPFACTRLALPASFILVALASHVRPGAAAPARPGTVLRFRPGRPGLLRGRLPRLPRRRLHPGLVQETKGALSRSPASSTASSWPSSTWPSSS